VAPLRARGGRGRHATTAVAAGPLHGRAEAREAAVQLVEGETPPHLRVPAFSGPLPEPIFTEDPTIAVQRGQRPVALDSYMLLRVLRGRPALRRALVARFERREFGSVVLIVVDRLAPRH